MGDAVWYFTIGLLGVAALVDFRSRRIPNYVVVAGLVVWAIFVFVRGDLSRFGTDVIAGVPFLLFFGFFATRNMIGFGDVKMITVVAMLIGWYGALHCLAVAFGIGAVFSLIHLARSRVLGSFLLRWKRRDDDEVRAAAKHSLPFAPFLFVGTVTYMFIR